MVRTARFLARGRAYCSIRPELVERNRELAAVASPTNVIAVHMDGIDAEHA
jgi:homoserine dehydrogenase